MKILRLIPLSLVTFTSCKTFYKMEVNKSLYSFVDIQTPKHVQPFIVLDSTEKPKFTLVFSDEFKDVSIDISEWNVQNEFSQNGGADKAYIDYIRIYQKN